MPGRLRAARWVMLYAALAVAPLVVALEAAAASYPANWPAESAVAMGLAAFALLTSQFALVSRMSRLSAAIGLDALMQFHREMAVVALGFVIAHALLLGGQAGGWRAWSPVHGPAALPAGALAFWLTAVIAGSSFGRRRLRIGYEAWQIIHLVSACLIAVAALAHAVGMGRYSSTPLMRATLVAYAALFVGLLARYRVVRPMQLGSRPWEVVANEDLGASTRLLTVRAVGHAGLSFRAGQFVWLITGRSPLLSQHHPLSLASAPAQAGMTASVQFAIKALGDWSGRVVPVLQPGRRVWIDGPYGAFTPRAGATPLVLIAGGIGIAPMRSILHGLVAERAGRRVVLFYAAANWSRVVYRAELEEMQGRLPLAVVYVFEHPPADWTGERGFITAEMLRRHVPGNPAEADYFVCGPIPMVDAIERLRAGAGIPASRVHTERFQMV